MKRTPERAVCFEPMYDERSKVLILGTIPSVESVRNGFYYMNKYNYFWRLLSDVTGEDYVIPTENLRNAKGEAEAEKARLKIVGKLKENGIALFDTISECERVGSTDDKIGERTLNSSSTVLSIIKGSKIKKIFLTSGEAENNLKRSFGGKAKAEKALREAMGLSVGEEPFCKILSPSRRARQSYSERLSSWQKLADFLSPKGVTT